MSMKDPTVPTACRNARLLAYLCDQIDAFEVNGLAETSPGAAQAYRDMCYHRDQLMRGVEYDPDDNPYIWELPDA